MARPPRSGWRVRRKAAGIRSVTSCSIWGARTRIPFGDVARAPVTGGWDIVTIAPAVLDRMARGHAVAVGVPNSSPARRLGLVHAWFRRADLPRSGPQRGSVVRQPPAGWPTVWDAGHR